MGGRTARDEHVGSNKFSQDFLVIYFGAKILLLHYTNYIKQ